MEYVTGRGRTYLAFGETQLTDEQCSAT
ncbi:hypothetical protein ACLBOM_21940 [Escherichia coli]